MCRPRGSGQRAEPRRMTPLSPASGRTTPSASDAGSFSLLDAHGRSPGHGSCPCLPARASGCRLGLSLPSVQLSSPHPSAVLPAPGPCLRTELAGTSCGLRSCKELGRAQDKSAQGKLPLHVAQRPPLDGSDSSEDGKAGAAAVMAALPSPPGPRFSPSHKRAWTRGQRLLAHALLLKAFPCKLETRRGGMTRRPLGSSSQRGADLTPKPGSPAL